MKKSAIIKYLILTTISLTIFSLISVLFGLGFMCVGSRMLNAYAQGSVVSRNTSAYGIQGPQDLKTDRERSLYQSILWMNERCAIQVVLNYRQGRMFVALGIIFISITLLNGIMWWKLKNTLK